MSRAYGKRTPRGLADLISSPPQDGAEGGVQPGELAAEQDDLLGSGESRGLAEQQGIGDPAQGRGWHRGIPGGQNHLANPPVEHQAVPTRPARPPYHYGLNSHGVPFEEHGRYDRTLDQGVRVDEKRPPLASESPMPEPVPVYIVEQGGGRDPLAITGTKRLTLPAAGSEPVQIVDQNEGRSLVQLLNEDSAHHARIGQLGDLAFDAQNSVIVGGSRLPANATSYMILRTQGPLWAVSETSNTVAISVVTEFQIANAG